jgi:hypothetical protein
MLPLPAFPQVNGEHLYVVVNAGCREKDLEHIGKHLKKAQVRPLSLHSLPPSAPYTS